MDNNNKQKYNGALINNNLIGSETHRNFLKIQTEFMIAYFGGSCIPATRNFKIARLASDINLLSTSEKKHLIFSGTIFTN